MYVTHERARATRLAVEATAVGKSLVILICRPQHGLSVAACLRPVPHFRRSDAGDRGPAFS
jgi:hypothetical protein